MKMLPIEYQAHASLEGHYFYNDNGDCISERKLIFTPCSHKEGNALSWRIEEEFSNAELSINCRYRVVDRGFIHDKEMLPHKDRLDALCSGMVNGRIAENMMFQIYYDLFIEKDMSILDKYFPSHSKRMQGLKVQKESGL